jgi:hypothetical protein
MLIFTRFDFIFNTGDNAYSFGTCENMMNSLPWTDYFTPGNCITPSGDPAFLKIPEPVPQPQPKGRIRWFPSMGNTDFRPELRGFGRFLPYFQWYSYVPEFEPRDINHNGQFYTVNASEDVQLFVLNSNLGICSCVSRTLSKTWRKFR